MRGEQLAPVRSGEPVTEVPARTEPWRIIEAAAFGLACSGGLIWAGGCLVAIFRPEQLARPYWPALRGLRTDTAAALAFVVVGAGFAVSEYLRLGRRQCAHSPRTAAPQRPALCRALQAAAATAAIMSAGIVAYLSANQVTHPLTIGLQATHFASWPTEGTLRALALLLCAASTAVLRWFLADRTGSVPREGTRTG